MSNAKISQTTSRSNPLRLDRVIARTTPTGRFRKDLLPPTRDFYESELGKLTGPNGKGWALGNCPSHKSKSGKSFSVNVDSGAFHCWGCDARGSDIIDFIRLRDGLSFKEACRQLGCWDEAGKPVKVRPGPLVHHLVIDFTIDGVEYQSDLVRDEPTTELQLDRWFHAAAADRLAQIRDRDAEKFEGEQEVQWGILATSWELIRMEVISAR
jgi:hypothetical protein